MNKQALRNAVRAQLDVDEEELPNERVDLYLADAVQQTLALEQRWPFLEAEWELRVYNGEPVQLPIDLAGIETVYMFGQGQTQLIPIDHAEAEREFGRQIPGGLPEFFSRRNGCLYLWPPPSSDLVELLVSGYRKPADFFTADAGNEPDCDERLHLSLVWYACALAQAANEDEVLDSLYGQKWQRGVERAREDIMRPEPYSVRILNGGGVRRSGRWLRRRFDP